VQISELPLTPARLMAMIRAAGLRDHPVPSERQVPSERPVR